MPMKHLVIVTREFPPQDGGIAQVAYEIAKQGIRSGIKISVLCWDFDARKWPDTTYASLGEGRIVRIPQPVARVDKIRSLVRELTKLCGQGADRILATTWNFSGAAAAWMKWRFKIPFGVIVHGYEVSPSALSTSDRLLMHAVLRRADRIFSVSRFTQSLLNGKKLPASRMQVIPNGVDIQTFAPSLRGAAVREKLGITGRKILMTVARLFPRKGHDKVIEALPAVLRQVPNAVYVIVGEGAAKKKLMAKCDELGVRQHVIFAGYVLKSELPDYYAACDVFIMPNREISDPKDPWVGDFEGFGISFIEASASGKPVIAGRSAGAVDAVEEGVSGLLVNPHEVGEIADAAVRLLKDEQLACQMGSAGRKRTELFLNWDVISQRYLDEFNRF